MQTQLQKYLLENNPNHDFTIVKCDPKIFSKGKSVLLVDGPKEQVQLLVQSISKMTNIDLDWHYSGGIAQVLIDECYLKFYKVFNTFKLNLVNELIITLKNKDDISPELYDSLFHENAIFQINTVESKWSDHILSYEVYVNDLQSGVITDVLSHLVEANKIIIETNKRWIPFDKISVYRFVEYNTGGLYRSTRCEEDGEINNAGIEELRVVRKFLI